MGIVTRVQHIPEGMQAPDSGSESDLGKDTSYRDLPQSRVYTGAMRHIAGQEEVDTSGGRAFYQVDRSGKPGGSVIATRQRVQGHDTVEMIPGDPGSRTHLKMAVRDGLIREAHPGVFEDVKTAAGQQRSMATNNAEAAAAQQEQQAQQERQTEVDHEGIFDAREDEAWQRDFANVPDHAFRLAAASVVNAVATDGSFDKAAMLLARDAALEPEKAAEMVENAVWAQTQVVNRAIEKVGIGEDQREAFYEACRKDQRGLQNAMQYLMHCRDVVPFQTMARAWLEKTERRSQVENDRNASETAGATPRGAHAELQESLRAGGFDTSVNRQGVLMVRPVDQPNGRWVAMSDLAK